jgi:hypothetical protein
MADSSPPGPKNVVDDISADPSHQDQSNDTKNIREEDELMEFDTLDRGAWLCCHISFSPSTALSPVVLP